MYERGRISDSGVVSKCNRTSEGEDSSGLIELLPPILFPLLPSNNVRDTIRYLPFKGTIIYAKLVCIYVRVNGVVGVGALSCNKRNYPLEETAFDTVRVFLSPTAERGRGFEL